MQPLKLAEAGPGLPSPIQTLEAGAERARRLGWWKQQLQQRFMTADIFSFSAVISSMITTVSGTLCQDLHHSHCLATIHATKWGDGGSFCVDWQIW